VTKGASEDLEETRTWRRQHEDLEETTSGQFANDARVLDTNCVCEQEASATSNEMRKTVSPG